MGSESEDEDPIIDYLDDPHEKTLVELESKDDLETSKRKKKFTPNFDHPGIKRIIIDTASQKSLGVEVGIDVTGEHPWKCVKKELIFDNIEVLLDKSPYAPYKMEIELHEDEDMLMGYILEETQSLDEYYFCITEDAKKHCEAQWNRILKRQLKKLNQYVYKSSKGWESLGSEKEVDDFLLQTSRPLIRLEVKMKYPRESAPKRFQIRHTDAVRDGYLELISGSEQENISKRRIDAAVQAIPETCDSEAQTELKFPQNVWTQCNAEDCDEQQNEDAAKKEAEIINEKLKNILPNVLNMVEFNSVLDIYNIDYPALITDDGKCTELQDIYFEETVFFTNVTAKDKFVSSVSWHPGSAGIMAVAYSDCTLNITEPKEQLDQIHRDVHGNNPVLIWDLCDNLNPKLYLDSKREVKTVSFCPKESDLLVGGCSNGQVVIWDLHGKLIDGNGSDILSENQEQFRKMVDLELHWMNLNEQSLVKPDVISDLNTSHSDAITDITWVSFPCESIGCKKVNCKCSLQFLTVSLDGNILIWSLDVKGKSRAYNLIKSARVKVTLTELNLEVSKYHVFDRYLKPFYKIMVGEQGSSSKLALTTVSFRRANQDKKESIWLGSLYGELCKIDWIDDEKILDQTSEYSTFLLNISLHDGPVACCTRNPFCDDLIATVGGKIFAVWSECLKGKPLLWKKMDYNMTNAAWSPHVPSQIFITTQRGDIDVWDFLQRSDSPTKSQKICGEALTGVYLQKMSNSDKAMAVADSKGSLRIFTLSDSLIRSNGKVLEDTLHFFKRELEAKLLFDDWEKKWFEKHAERIQNRKKAEEMLQKEKEKKAKLKARKERERRELEAEKYQKEEAVKTIDRAEELRNIEWQYALKSIQEIKKMDKASLMKLEKPLREMEALKKNVAAKQIAILKRQSAIFDETVSIYFPEVLIKDEGIKITVKEDFSIQLNKAINEYREISENGRSFVDKNAYELEFDWEKILLKAKERRKSLKVHEVLPPTRVIKIAPEMFESQISLTDSVKSAPPIVKKLTITEPHEAAGSAQTISGITETMRSAASTRKLLSSEGERDDQKTI